MMSDLEDVLVPIYLYHRYQTEATVKLIGGVEYHYAVRGDQQSAPQMVDGEVQRNAMSAMLKTLDPEVLALPEHLLDMIPPRPARIAQTREHFRGYTDPNLDPVAIAELAADHAAGLIFNPNRAARLLNQKARDGSKPGLDYLINKVVENTVLADQREGYHGSIQRAINTAVLRNLIHLAADKDAAPDVQSVSALMLNELEENLIVRGDSGEMIWRAHYQKLADTISDFKEDPSTFEMPPAPYTPPGAPIGSGRDNYMFCSH